MYIAVYKIGSSGLIRAVTFIDKITGERSEQGSRKFFISLCIIFVVLITPKILKSFLLEVDEYIILKWIIIV